MQSLQAQRRWLPFVARLDDMGSYSWGLIAPRGFDTYSFPLASKWATYLPTSDRKEERVVQRRLALDRLGDRDIVWEPYASLDVMAVVHPEILTEEHSRLWRACTCLIYFIVIEWHQVDRHEPEPASNIDWLHAKDGRGGDRWFPSYYQVWHLSWQNRVDAVLSIPRCLIPGRPQTFCDSGTEWPIGFCRRIP
ncbi:hypothetical protein Ahy_B10g106014 [Arachis hypogaea]|uniref:Aminotransferase-like plant mobile domain-containing protein n=1 Tax=Arachis hypogaea TaxID=3818 RepID=A0A444X9L1_ARAHY|nr:hypothetical protein Ahy_B10g106014 [Arachis hypogaea]